MIKGIQQNIGMGFREVREEIWFYYQYRLISMKILMTMFFIKVVQFKLGSEKSEGFSRGLWMQEKGLYEQR